MIDKPLHATSLDRRNGYAYGDDVGFWRRIDYSSTVSAGSERLKVRKGVDLAGLPHSAEVGRLLLDHDIPVFA